MNKSEQEFRLRLIEKEIDTVSSKIDHYDDLVFRIKSWSITIWIAIIGYGISKENKFIILIGIFPVILFWINEGLFKMYQDRIARRLTRIEKYISSKYFDNFFKLKNNSEYIDEYGKLNISELSSFSKETRKLFWKKKDFIKNMFKINVWPLYCIMLFFNIILFYVAKFVF